MIHECKEIINPLKYYIEKDNVMSYIVIYNKDSYFDETIPINFCPWCGKKL